MSEWLQWHIWNARRALESGGDESSDFKLPDARFLKLKQAFMLIAGGGYQNAPKGYSYLCEWLFSFGPGKSWADLEAWQRMRGLKLSAWERDMLHDLSQQWKAHGENPKLRSPYPMTAEEFKREFNKLKRG